MSIKRGLLQLVKDNITITPNHVIYLQKDIHQGILPRMLQEILDTRVMVKKTMKSYKHNRTLYKMLDARQLGLKLLANVTYGYTAASFSGRMPCVDIADSIVQTARETLERV